MDKYPVAFAFCTSRKRRIFLAGDIPRSFTELAGEAMSSMGIDINDIKFFDYGVAMSVNSPPDIAPEKIVTKLKSATSRRIRERYKELWSMPALWTKAYWYGTGTLNEKALSDIKEFFEKQPSR